MRSQELWKSFLATGAPELYVLYTQARNAEGLHVFDDPGPGITGDQLQ